MSSREEEEDKAKDDKGCQKVPQHETKTMI
jgi:hypothetical protein